MIVSVRQDAWPSSMPGTDLDLTISTEVDAQIEVEGSITLPSKKLNDIFTRLSENLVTFELNEETNLYEMNAIPVIKILSNKNNFCNVNKCQR